MDILIGTRNKYKFDEMLEFLKDIPNLTVHTLDELAQTIKVEEDQQTLLKNAEKKAKEISQHTQWYVLASDGGNDIPALGDKWDVLRNQRIVGENKTDKEKVEVLLNLMKDLSQEDRNITCHFALALAKNGQLLWSDSDIIDKGYLLEKSPNVDIPPYLWIGHIWYYPEFKKTFTQLTLEEKAKVRLQSSNLKTKLQQFLEKLI